MDKRTAWHYTDGMKAGMHADRKDMKPKDMKPKRKDEQ